MPVIIYSILVFLYIILLIFLICYCFGGKIGFGIPCAIQLNLTLRTFLYDIKSTNP